MITATKNQAWMTPRPLFNTLHREYSFTVDAAASIANHLLPRYWTRSHNALGQSLRYEVAFCNPPFGMIRRFLDWGYAQRHEGHVCFLLPANVETSWWHEMATLGDKHVFRRRVAYKAPPGIKESTPSFASMLLFYGPTIAPSGIGFSRVRDGVTGAYL